MMNDTTNLLSWAIQSGMVNKRPDLSLTYYPSSYDFYWFVARLYNFLRNEGEDNLKYPEQKYCLRELQLVLHKKATQNLLDFK